MNTEKNEFKTTVYRKDTNTGICLIADSECVDKYKNSVISSYITKAIVIL